MPSYEPLIVSPDIKCAANVTPLARSDFNLGIAEQWLELCQLELNQVAEIQDHIARALEQCKDARTLLREIVPTIGIHSGEGVF